MRSRHRAVRNFFLPALLLFFIIIPAAAQDPAKDLTELSLEELMNIRVTLASKRAQRISDAAAAVYVITQEDLARSGVSSLPEALRMVPGMQVARIDANKWAVTSRGFNSRFANKLLVLIDGRSVYTPLYSGVQWDVQDVALEDVWQIEVIRGPGATLWGANAVNGVINIITKHTKETPGGLAEAEIGSSGQRRGLLRFGGSVGEGLYYRAYAKGLMLGDFASSQVRPANDQWEMARGGVRVDWQRSPSDQFSLLADVYQGDLHQTLTSFLPAPPYARVDDDNMKLRGVNALVRWNHEPTPSSNLKLHFFMDRTEREDGLHEEHRTTFDFDIQYGFQAGEVHEVVLGAGHRVTTDRLTPSATVAFVPGRRTDNLTSAFVQDEIRLSEALALTVGSKFERNSYTGFEIQPNVRMLWTVDSSWTVWSSVSRALRTPSRADHNVDFVVASFPGMTIHVLGNPRFRSEVLTAYEAGIRHNLSSSAIELAAYYNVYDDLRTVEPTGNPSILQFDNLLEGVTYGLELNTTWRLNSRWKLSAGYALFLSEFRLRRESRDVSSALLTGGESPKHQFHIRSSVNPVSGLELDGIAYYVARLRNQQIPQYWRLDTRVAWHVTSSLTISAVGQNLLSAQHPEFGRTPLGEWATEVPRLISGKVSIRF